MRCCTLLFLLPLLTEAFVHYEIEGTYSAIKPDEVQAHLANRAGFWLAENKIRQRLRSLDEKLVIDFYVDFFEIHGEEHQRPTAIFHGYLTTQLSRAEIEDAIDRTDDVHLYILARRESLPAPSSLVSFDPAVSSCSNGGVLLPNSTCACKPFYSGDTCQTVQCLHEGNQIGARCSCPPGVSTVNCEPRKCQPAVSGDFSRAKSSFTLVINQDVKVVRSLMALITNLEHLPSPEQYNTFIVVNYLDSAKGFYMQQKQFKYYTDMVDYLGSINLGTGYDRQPTNKAALVAQSFTPNMYAFSEVIVLTAAPDSETSPPNYLTSSQNVEDRLVFKSLAWRNRITYFVQNAKDNIDSFHRISKATFGNVFYVDTSDLSASGTIFDTVLPSLPASEVVTLEYGTAMFTAVPLDITGTQYGNVTLFVTIKPGVDFPSIQNSKGDTLLGTSYKYAKIFMFSTDDTVTITGTSPWVAKALAPTTTTALLGYSDNSDVDVGNAYLITGMDNTLAGQVVDFATTSLTLELIDIDSGTSLKTFTSSDYNADCSYSFSFGNARMTDPGSYIQKITFVDGTGVNNTRLIPGMASSLEAVYRPPFQCFNGGTDNGDGTCTCPARFNNASDCSVPNCGSYPVNQFPGNGQGLCKCPQGTTGDFCDQAVCYNNPDDQLGYTNRSIAVVIQASWSQAGYNDAIFDGLKGLFKNAKYDEFILTTFNIIRSGGSDIPKVNTTIYNTPDSFLSAISSISYSATFASKLNVLDALDSALKVISYDKSPAFVFLDSLPSSTNAESTVLSEAVSKFVQINVIGSPSILADSMVDLSYYQNIAFATGGLYLDTSTVTDYNTTYTITEFVDMYGYIFPNTEIVSEQPPSNCSLGVTATAYLKPDPAKLSWFVINSANSVGFNVSFDGLPQNSVSDIPTVAIYQIDSDWIASSPNNKVTVKVAGGGGVDLCSWKFITQSTDVVTTEFLQLGHTNFTKGLNFGNAYLPSAFSLTDLTKKTDSQTAAITITNTQGKVIYTNKADVSGDCSKQVSFTDPFGCDSANDQYIVTMAVTLDSYTLQRSQRALCYIPYGTCLHGGMWDSGSKQCYCTGDPNFTGDRCATPICQNGGKVANKNSEGLCSCLAGYSGDFCQNRVCPNMNFMEAADARETDYDQLVFVVNTNVDMLLVSIYLKNLIQNITAETATPSNPRQYTLITFDEANVQVVSSTFDSTKFQNEFNAAMGSFSKTKNVPTRALDALHQALASVVQPAAVIFLITGSGNSTDPSINTQILPKQRLGTQINVIYAPQGVAVPQPPADGRLATMARLTGGRVLPVTQNSLNILNKIVDATMTENALVEDGGSQFCDGDGVIVGFNVALGDQKIILVVTGDGIRNTLRVTDAFGNATTYKTVFSDTAAVIVEIDLPTNLPPGFWGFTMNTNNGSCTYQVWAVSPVRVVPGFSTTDNDDFPSSFPLIGKQKIAFRATGDPNIQLLGVEYRYMDDLYEPWTVGTGGGLQFTPRDASTCAYQWVTESISIDNSSYVRLALNGQVTGGTWFQRVFYYELPDPESYCQSPNGQADANTGLCVCNQNYFGDDCTQLNCQNGGTSSFGVCACPNGYSGQFCDKYTLSNATTTTTPKVTTTMSTTTTMTPSTSTQMTTSITSGTTTSGTTILTTRVIPTGSTTTVGTTISTASVGTVASSSTTISTTNAGTTTIPPVTGTGGTTPATTTASTTLPSTTTPTTTVITTTPTTTTTTMTTTTTVPTTTPTTTTGTTTLGPCAPAFTTYYFSFFVDSTYANPFGTGAFYSGENATICSVATTVNLGGETLTTFNVNGVNDDYYPGGLVNSTSDISALFVGGGLSGDTDSRNLNFTNAINQFLTAYPQVPTNAQPGFAVLFAQAQPLGSKEDFGAAIQRLRDANYQVLGVIPATLPDTATLGDPTDYFVSILGSSNVYPNMTNPTYAAQFINKRACQLKPV